MKEKKEGRGRKRQPACENTECLSTKLRSTIVHSSSTPGICHYRAHDHDAVKCEHVLSMLDAISNGLLAIQPAILRKMTALHKIITFIYKTFTLFNFESSTYNADTGHLTLNKNYKRCHCIIHVTLSSVIAHSYMYV